MSPAPAFRPCRAFLDDFSAFVDGQLPPDRRDELQAHVDCCQGCLDHLTAYRRGVTVLRSIETGAPEDFWERLERRLWVGQELTLVDGGGTASEAARFARRPGAAVTIAAAAVLALFLIGRGIGPESRAGSVGPRSVRASVAVTLPEVPEAGSQAVASTRPEAAPPPTSASSRPKAVASAELELPADGPASAPATSPERQLELLEERFFEGSLNRGSSALVSDGWIEPVRLGNGWSRSDRRPVSLIRASAAITPAPWNVEQAVSLP